MQYSSIAITPNGAFDSLLLHPADSDVESVHLLQTHSQLTKLLLTDISGLEQLFAELVNLVA